MNDLPEILELNITQEDIDACTNHRRWSSRGTYWPSHHCPITVVAERALDMKLKSATKLFQDDGTVLYSPVDNDYISVARWQGDFDRGDVVHPATFKFKKA